MRKHSPINNAICCVWILQTVSEHIVELDTNSSLTFRNLRNIFGNLRMSSETVGNCWIIFGNKRQKSHAFDSGKVGRYSIAQMPTHWSYYWSCFQFFWALGSTFLVVIALIVMPTLGWRWLTAFATLPVVIFIILSRVSTLNPFTPRVKPWVNKMWLLLLSLWMKT